MGGSFRGTAALCIAKVSCPFMPWGRGSDLFPVPNFGGMGHGVWLSGEAPSAHAETQYHIFGHGGLGYKGPFQSLAPFLNFTFG